MHHVALICADVERTTRFYQEVLGFPLTTMFENRDLAGSTHFFFDLGHGQHDRLLRPARRRPRARTTRCSAGSTTSPSRSRSSTGAQAKERLDADGIPYDHVDETSLYFRGPDGERLELIADPLRWMYGERVD